MPALALIQLEFLNQSHWWTAVVVVTALALFVYALLLRREAGKDMGGVVRPPPLTLGGLSLASASLVAGIISLGLTIPIALLAPRYPLAGQYIAMPWTLLVLLSAVFLFYRRVYRFLPRFRMAALFALRSLGLITLTFLLFQPVLGFIKTPDHKPRLAIIVDATGSMSYADAPNQPNRYRQAAIAVQNTLVPRLEKSFEVQIYAYDGRHPAPLTAADELDAIPPQRGRDRPCRRPLARRFQQPQGGHSALRRHP